MMVAINEVSTENNGGTVDVAALRSAVEKALETCVARFLDSHGGAVRVGHISADGDVSLEFYGACQSCPAAAATFYSRVLPALRDLPHVRRVITSKVTISEAAIQRLSKLSNKTIHPPSVVSHGKTLA